MSNATSKTVLEVGTTIGKAIARDVIADDMPREWTGLDAQDGDMIPADMDREEVERVAREVYEAEIAAAK